MDGLPDEVLLNILSFVSDAHALLDSVPLVCWRWYRLARDRRAWVSAKLTVYTSLTDGNHAWFLASHDARVLSHAPRLRALRLIDRKTTDPQVVRLVAALDSAGCRIDKLQLPMLHSCRASTAVLDALVRLVGRQPGARSLHVYLGGGVVAQAALYKLIGKLLPSVAELVLEVGYISYTTQLQDAVAPVLRTLRWTINSSRELRDQPYEALLADLLTACSSSLRHLQLPERMRLTSERPVRALAQCEALATLSMNAKGVDALHGPRALRELSLHIRSSNPKNDFMAVERDLAGADLAALRDLQLSVSRYTGTDCGKVLVALSRAAPRLRCLSVECCRSFSSTCDEKISQVLLEQEELQEVSLVAVGDVALRAVLTKRLMKVTVDAKIPAQAMDDCTDLVVSYKKKYRQSARGDISLTPVMMSKQHITW